MSKSIRVFMCIVFLVVVGVIYAQEARSRPSVSPQALLDRIGAQEDVLVLDVRTPEEYRIGHVPGAINVPHHQLHKRLDEVRSHQNKEVVVYCERGVRAGVAEEVLQQAGFAQVLHLKGDMVAWRQHQLPMATP